MAAPYHRYESLWTMKQIYSVFSVWCDRTQSMRDSNPSAPYRQYRWGEGECELYKCNFKRISPLPLSVKVRGSGSGENVQRMGNFITISVIHVIPRVLLKKAFIGVRNDAKTRLNGKFFHKLFCFTPSITLSQLLCIPLKWEQLELIASDRPSGGALGDRTRCTDRVRLPIPSPVE